MLPATTMSSGSQRIGKALDLWRTRGARALGLQLAVFARDKSRLAAVRLASRILRAAYRLRWGASFADPQRLILVDPARIVHRVRPPFHPVHLAGGDWDLPPENAPARPRARRLVPFRDMAVYRFLEEHFLHGTPWTETRLFRHKREHPERPCTDYNDYRYATLADVEARGRELDALHDAMRRNGYQPQPELDGRPGHEITVAIGRDGQIFWNGTGQHRLALAMILGLPAVPVRVGVRHRLWQRLRRDAERGRPLPPGLCAHPDLREFAPPPAPQAPAAEHR